MRLPSCAHAELSCVRVGSESMVTLRIAEEVRASNLNSCTTCMLDEEAWRQRIMLRVYAFSDVEPR